MRSRPAVSSVIVITSVLLAGGCSRNAEPPPPEPAAGAAAAEEGRRAARVLDLQEPAAAPSSQAPASLSHTWDVPAGWVEETPASNMRRAQYRVPGPDGDGECIVFYFGQGQGGDAASNAVRWAGQFTQPDGGSSVERMQMAPLEGTRVPVQIVEVTGTYDGGMTMTTAPAESKTGYMLLGGIAQGTDGSWFFKFTGPEATVRAQRESFVGMMESFGPRS